MSAVAHYYFIPTVRDGLAACVEAAPPASKARASIEARLTPHADDETGAVLTRSIALYGPGDVVALDPSCVARTDPRPNVGDYEPNFMPLIEFTEPDFPWRFTPDVAENTARGKLQPWIALIVLRAGSDEFTGLGERKPDAEQTTKLPIRWIEGVSLDALPSLDHAWMWAHVHVTSEDGLTIEDVRDVIDGLAETDLAGTAISRLVCPRRLSPNTKYVAFVVPTFKLGQVAAGLAQLADITDALTPSWSAEAGPSVNLPYYYSFEFATGVRGDFESLVRLLVPRELPGLGVRQIEVSGVQRELLGADAPDAPLILHVEGALRSPDVKFTRWGADQIDPATLEPSPETTQTQIALAELLNLAASSIDNPTSTADDDDDPQVTPPIYGRWHAGSNTVEPEAPTAWLNHMNLDPRHRVAAALGTAVVDKQQEALMASLWEQLGDIESANEAINYGKLGRAASTGIWKRLSALGEADYLWLAQPVLKRTTTSEGGGTKRCVAKVLAASAIPKAAFDPAFRRLMRRRSAMRRRGTIPTDAAREHVLTRMNKAELLPAGPPPALTGMPSLCSVTDAALQSLPAPSSNRGCNLLEMLFPSAGKPTPPPAPGTPRLNDFCEEAITPEAILEATTEMGAELQLHQESGAAAASAFAEWLRPVPTPPNRKQVDLKAIRDVVELAIDPQATIPARVNSRITVGPGIHRKGPLGRLESEVEFPHPMYAPLRDMAQDWILPGVESVPQNTISIVQTNRRFIESYMVGLCHAMSGEAIWRGAPVYIWTTFFRQFWDVRGCIPPDADPEQWKDIHRLTRWSRTSTLGGHNPRPGGGVENAVVLVRGDLLKRYPNTLVYAVQSMDDGDPALPDCAGDATLPDPLTPILTGTLPPDLTFLGFDITPAELCSGGPNGKGYYIVLEERLGEPRFGFDIPDDESVETMFSGSSAWWYDLSWSNFQPSLDGAFEPFPENVYIDERVPRLAAGRTPVWGASAASVANICLQRPMRIAVHASQMLSEFACS